MLRLVVVVALIGLCARPARAFDHARPMGLYAAATGAPLAMLDSTIDVTVRGPIVETVVVQRFSNPGDAAIEATYIFPLPADAAVSAMAIQVGARTIHAAIEAREAAQRRYEAAVAAGAPAARLDEERPDVFTQNVAAIPGKATIEVTVRYDTVARFESGAWQLVLPMVVAPRAVPGTASGQATTGSGRAPDTDRAPDASRITPAVAPGAGGPTAVTIHFVDEPSELTSPSHALGGTRRDATLVDPRSDHDAIVRWRAPAPSAGWVERDADGSGFAAVVVEAAAPPASRKPVRVILAIDRAATTRGDGEVVERPIVRALLDGLGGGDRVRVIGSVTTGWAAADDARAAIDRAWDAPAGAFDLTRVLAGAHPDGAAIVLVSDGLVADDAAAIAAARRLGVAVHVIGIGPAPARATLTQLAAVTGGTARFAVAGDDLAALAHNALADVATPPAPLAITWGTLAASEVEPVVLPRLGVGQAMIAFARIKHAGPANARVRGDVFAFEALAPARAIDGEVTARGPLARRWARERLGGLLAGKHDRAGVTRLALAYGLVSPYTSLVAVGDEIVARGGVKHSVAVPVSLPSGMRWYAVTQAIDPVAPPTHAAGKKAGATDDSDRPAAAPPQAASSDREGPAPIEVKGEQIVIEGRAPVITKSNTAAGVGVIGDILQSNSEMIGMTGERSWQLSTEVAGGVSFDHGVHSLASLAGRLRYGDRNLVGGELALWIVDGNHAQGRGLLAFDRALGRRSTFELGVGAGVHFGEGTGVAGALRVRVNTPLPMLSGFLRYDTAVLLTRPTVDVEHAITLGVEVTFRGW
jgi:Ca-activated chloride channel family protein